MTNLDYLYNPDAAKEHFSKNYFSDKKLGFQIIEHGTILPYKNKPPLGGLRGALGGIVDSNGSFIKGSFLYDRSIGREYTPPPRINSKKQRNCHLSRIFFSCLGACPDR